MKLSGCEDGDGDTEGHDEDVDSGDGHGEAFGEEVQNERVQTGGNENSCDDALELIS